MTGAKVNQNSFRLNAAIMPAAVALAILLAAPAMIQPAQAQSYTILYSFAGKPDGANPWAPLLRDSAGDLFGTTSAGGDLGSGYGVFFKLKSDGTETILHTFDLKDGQRPVGPVVRDSTGNFYGTTYLGGSSFTGTIYKMDKTGTLTTLFTLHPYVGEYPVGGVILDSAGNLYGANPVGGGSQTGPTAYAGDVFELSNAGVYTVLHHFIEGTTDGAAPNTSVLRDSLGNLYGTAYIGGNYHCAGGCGVVFKVSATGVEKVIHRFTGKPNDGWFPLGGLIRDHAGNFYGATRFGGTADQGTVFKIDTTGKETVLYGFLGGADGAQPLYENLVMDSAGNIYGTTSQGGGGDCASLTFSGCGTVFEIDTAGVETILHAFTGAPTDGAIPFVGLTLGADGNLYGTTYYGGAANAGTVFRVAP